MPTNWQSVTDYVILGSVVALILYNVVAGVMGGGPATISARMQHYGYKAPMIVGVWFALGSHWWWEVYTRN